MKFLTLFAQKFAKKLKKWSKMSFLTPIGAFFQKNAKNHGDSKAIFRQISAPFSPRNVNFRPD